MRTLFILLAVCLMPLKAHAGFFDLDTVATGDTIHIDGGAKGRVFAVGWKIFVDKGDYNQALFLTGANVEIQPKAHAPVYIFGQNINIDGTFAGALAAAGQDIKLAKTTKVSSNLWLSGQVVWLSGEIPAGGKVLANRVIIDGHITHGSSGKALDIQAAELELTENAIVDGQIIYRSKNAPRVATNARVNTPIHLETATFEDELKEKLKQVAFLGKLGSKLMLLVWLLIAGLVVSVFMAPKMRASLKRVRNKPLHMMGAGLGYLVAVPLAAVFLFVTVVGMPVAISLLASYTIAIMMGFSIGTLFIGTLIYEAMFRRRPLRRHQFMGCYVMGMVLVILVTRLPYVGFLGWLLPLAGGLGAFSWLKWQQMQAGKE